MPDPKKIWRHDELAQDLGEHLVRRTGRRAYLDLQLGPAGSPRPDVFTICHSYQSPEPLSYEIKISRSDFQSDVGSGKWRKYLNFSTGVFFAVPKGLIARDEIPADCGLIVRFEKVWRVAKRPAVRSIQIPQSVLLKIAFDSGHKRVWGEDPEPREINQWVLAAKIRRDLGDLVAKIVGDTMLAESDLIERKKQIEGARVIRDKIKAEAHSIEAQARAAGKADLERQHHELCDVLGIPGPSSKWAINAAIREARNRLSQSGEIAHLTAQIQAIKTALVSAESLREFKE